jgi:hypothetical protein
MSLRGAVASVIVALAVCGGDASGQVPKPFPTPATQPPRSSPPTAPEPTKTPATKGTDPKATPSEATLGLPIYPDSKFITSYDAGRGQRYYLFGTTANFTEVVAYYRTALKNNKGELVFDAPATHMFEVGRFREETMAFPPGVTVKDYTWGGSAGYPNPKLGEQPARFPTIIQIVPLPEGAQ